MSKININGAEITVIKHKEEDYICLTDMVKNSENSSAIIENWLRNKNTLEFIGVWERLNNVNFKTLEFEGIKNEAGLNRFHISAKKLIDNTDSIGLVSKAGRYGGTYAHKDIAFEFAMWISAEFKLLLIKDFQRLKDQESKSLNGIWDYRRFLTKSNYRIQTDAVKDIILPMKNLPKDKEGIAYAEEADLLYLVMFGYNSATWRKNNPELALKGHNLRDFADTHQLIVLNNLEILNAELIREGMPIEQRFAKLRTSAHQQLKSLLGSKEKENQLTESPNKNIISSGNKDLDKSIGNSLKKGKPRS